MTAARCDNARVLPLLLLAAAGTMDSRGFCALHLAIEQDARNAVRCLAATQELRMVTVAGADAVAVARTLACTECLELVAFQAQQETRFSKEIFTELATRRFLPEHTVI
eukprot:gnl/Ergobibamus_cyprinoides/1050.p2 GENE.gnl/Ergobibamus_cyprinoides/1050~~gnl/Ergobibamus_cyprinoides/1050.p2  ORF type:complete len:109 (+),score=16.42 gnl/Ergobibamus_cyprinoides/1050:475-801(+)